MYIQGGLNTNKVKYNSSFVAMHKSITPRHIYDEIGAWP